jgi:cysteine desulfuration protein SufE
MKLETIIEDFEFIEDWEDRYKYIIDLGKSLDPLLENDYNTQNKVDGCASQVWLIIKEDEIKEKKNYRVQSRLRFFFG